MTEIGFYHLQKGSVAEALPRLLEKAVAGGFRVLVRTPSQDEAETLSRALWTFDPASFLPHGTAADGWEAEQPIYLTGGEENPNHADLACQVGGAEVVALDGFKRAVDMFDGRDEAATAAARERWKRYRAAGHTVIYWQQKPGGGWEKKA
ncbi:MAG TPA: DNA polymerase III subunit chi [Stellaceae bacterium]|nr:DNA polymerase III subunit chi [Stellaceae bacterium]